MKRSLIFIPLVLFFVQSCLPAAQPAIETGPAAIEIQGSPAASLITATQESVIVTLPSATPTQEAAPLIPTSTPTLAACMKAGGRVELEHYTTDLLPKDLVYHIYLPPCYDEEAGRRYPVLYLVHGKNATDYQWITLGVPDTLDRLVAIGELPPFIVVMPRDRVWSEPTVDNFGLAVVQSLVPWVDKHYRTLPDREHRAIGGLSRGGAWALNIGFSHPELFSAVGMHSGIVFDTDVVNLFQWLKNFPEGMTPRIYQDIGDADRPEIIKLATWVESMLTRYEIPHEWHMYKGGHDDVYWRAHVEEYLRWYSQDWSQ